MIDLAHLITLIAQADTNGELSKTGRGKLVVEAAKRLTAQYDLFDYWKEDDPFARLDISPEMKERIVERPCPLCGRDMNKVGKRCGRDTMCLRCAGQRRGRR